ncbi:MAG TPA: CBS domain-containing protein [Thermoplasmata archaeon]|jgi:signal-transduction protein with cAMP-binding, CBS, and nucleotidyltransferase domain|nr:CBS domain-containing protein [Thermoplasmata archaeon]
MVLLAKDIMDTSMLSMDDETDALTCARAMVAQRKGYSMVTHGSPKSVTGIVTEWDFLEKVLAAGKDPTQVRLKELASVNLQSCLPDTPTDEVVSTMARLGVRRLVVRAGDQVLGVITTRNILATFRKYVDKLSSEIAGYQSSTTPLG